MKKMIIAGMTTGALLLGSFALNHVSAAETAQFKDVPASHWARTVIDRAVANGYLKGYADGTFQPNRAVTKAEMAAILSRLPEQPTVVPEMQATFTDIPAWAADGVKGAIGKGFINPGLYGTKMQAKEALTRGELAVWLTNGLTAIDADYGQALKDVTHTVVPAREYFTGKLDANNKSAVAVALGTGLMTVGSDKNFGLERTVTRAEVATILARYNEIAKKKPEEFLGLKELREVGLTGTNLTTVTKYRPVPQEKTAQLGGHFVDSFAAIRNKELKLVSNRASAKVLEMIVVDPDIKGEGRSIYAPVFLSDTQTFNQYSIYAFCNLSITPKVDRLDIVQAAQLFNNTPFSATGFPYATEPAKYGVNMQSWKNNPEFKKGVEANFWGAGSIRRNYDAFGTINIRTVDNDRFYFAIPHE